MDSLSKFLVGWFVLAFILVVVRSYTIGDSPNFGDWVSNWLSDEAGTDEPESDVDFGSNEPAESGGDTSTPATESFYDDRKLRRQWMEDGSEGTGNRLERGHGGIKKDLYMKERFTGAAMDVPYGSVRRSDFSNNGLAPGGEVGYNKFMHKKEKVSNGKDVPLPYSVSSFTGHDVAGAFGSGFSM